MQNKNLARPIAARLHNACVILCRTKRLHATYLLVIFGLDVAVYANQHYSTTFFSFQQNSFDIEDNADCSICPGHSVTVSLFLFVLSAHGTRDHDQTEQPSVNNTKELSFFIVSNLADRRISLAKSVLEWCRKSVIE